MRRMAKGCTSESHPLYGMFMSKLSGCIYEWDAEEYMRLLNSKREELLQAGVPNPSTSATTKAVTKEELARHCRRRTRGVEETTQLIEELLLSMSHATDTLGVPLFRKEIKEIWEEQQKHVSCLQDPPGISLYTITGYLQKGGISLPVLRCARGTTSLESFHLHLARFIPGSSAGDVNYQAYLLEGIVRWNAARAAAANPETRIQSQNLSSFDICLKERVCLILRD